MIRMIIICSLILTPVVSHCASDDWIRYEQLQAEQDQADSLHAIAESEKEKQHAEVGALMGEIISTEMSDDCGFSEVLNKDGSPRYVKTETGYHEEYLKICDGDPK